MPPLPSHNRRARLADITAGILRKTLWMLLVLWGITLISFWVIHLAPGSPTDMETTLNALRFYEKNDQYCFVTQKAIDGKLSFLEAYEVIR